MRATLALSLTLLLCATSALAEEKPTPEQSRFFEEKVRPLLVERCFRCHAEKKHEGSLRLDARQTIVAGGDSGPAIVPGKPDESLLIEAVRYRSLEMPPDRRLPKGEVDVLVKWVQMGAPWPGSAGEKILVPRKPGLEITDEDRSYWAFQPIRTPAVPRADSDWDDDNPIDAFVLDQLRRRGLAPSKPASKRQLARRLYFDLIGLPPTFEEVEQFVADDSPRAFARLVDRLLEKPQYGERWGRHWLDVVRFAQSNGYERDDEKPHAWRYRDYVIKAFNEDKPFDRFILEQLAGDELDDATLDSIIATGFYRVGVWDDEPDDKVAAVYEGLDDIVRTTGEAFLGLTIGCARCHDHKFDPIPQADYYSLLSFVRNVAPIGKDKSHTHWEMDPTAIFTPLVTRESLDQWEQKRKLLADQKAELEKQLSAEGTPKEKQEELKKQIGELDKQMKPAWEMALSVREIGAKPRETRILIRGSHLTPGKAVQPAFLTVTDSPNPKLLSPETAPGSSLVQTLRSQGVQPTTRRRRVLAEWIASPDNPLTARVIANRLWHYHFGRGLVSTPNDFGRTGQPPTHPKLLDWLASDLTENGWSLKHLHRRILLSKTWQQSSASSPDHRGHEVDPDNMLLWRQNLRRVESEVIRDSMLMLDLCEGKGGADSFLLSDSVSMDCTPILDSSQLVGVINQEDLLISYRAIEKVLRRATTDPVTGLPMRSVFERRIREEWRRAERTEESLAVILIDVDHFKDVNDRCGHLVGDAVLHMVGSCLKTSLRSYDLVARHGGDEFAAICFGCRPGEIDIPVARLLDAINRLSIPADPGGTHMISLSIGAAVMHGAFDKCQPLHLIETADRCLYRAKQNGRARAYRTEITGPQLELEIVQVEPTETLAPA